MRGLASVLLVLVLGCGGRPAPFDHEDDGGVRADGAAGGDGAASADGGTLAAFCSGAPRMRVNGATSTAAVTGRALWPNLYCEAANVAFIGSATPQRVVVNWQAPASPSPVAPFELDLARLPTGWAVRLYVGCSPSEAGCTPDETIDSGFTGSLRVTGAMLDYSVTVCLEFNETPGRPQRVLHSGRLWAADVHAPYPFD